MYYTLQELNAADYSEFLYVAKVCVISSMQQKVTSVDYTTTIDGLYYHPCHMVRCYHSCDDKYYWLCMSMAYIIALFIWFVLSIMVINLVP